MESKLDELINVNRDQQVINEGRKNRLKDVDAPLRDQIVQKLYDTLSDQGIAQYVSDQWNKGSAHRMEWLERQEEYLKQWDDHLTRDTDDSFKGWFNLHIPITFIVCKALHARFLQAIWQEPPFNCKARNRGSIDRVPVVRDTINYYLTRAANYGKGVGPVVDRWVWKWVTAGSGLMKERWDVVYTKYRDVKTIKKPAPPVIQTLNGQQVAIPQFTEEEVEADVVRKVFDGPVMENIPAEDLLMIGGGGDPDQADEVHHRSWLTASQLWTLVDRKVFVESEVEKVIESGRNRKSGRIGNDIKNQQAVNAGQASADSEAEHFKYEVVESHLRLDIDGSGIATDVVVWTHPQTRAFLGATYLYRIYKSGERPFIKADFLLRDGQEYGIGIPELIYPIQVEMDALHNMRCDFGLLSTMPFFFYKASSSLDPKKIMFEPGMGIPVDDPQRDIYFPQLGNRTVFGFQEEQALDTLIQRLTGINDITMGMLSQQGATRTASGARLVGQEMSTNLDVHLKRLNWGWDKALRFMLTMVQQRMPKGLSFRVTGDDGQDYWRDNLSTKDMEGDFDVEISSNTATSNQAIQQQTSDEIMQIVADPLAIQMSIITPSNFYEAKKNQLMARGVKDWGRFIQKPQDFYVAMKPVEEADLILAGIPVPIDPRMDHQGFIDFVTMFEKDELLHGQFTDPQHMAALKAQAMRHQQMMEALQATQNQQANSMQMQRNAAQSAQQAPMAAPSAQPTAAAQAPGAPAQQ